MLNTLPVINGQAILYDGDCANRTGLSGLAPYDGAGKEVRRAGEIVNVALQGASMPVELFAKLINMPPAS